MEAEAEHRLVIQIQPLLSMVVRVVAEMVVRDNLTAEQHHLLVKVKSAVTEFVQYLTLMSQQAVAVELRLQVEMVL
jgi:hypothetical protein